MKEKILQTISELNLQHVELKDPVKFSSPEHLQYLRQADVFVHPSITPDDGDKEGIPGALVEAMASGLPVVSTYHAGVPHVVQHQKTGLLTREWDIEQLAKLMTELAEHPRLRMNLGKNAQKFAVQELDIQKKEKDLEKIYDLAQKQQNQLMIEDVK